MKPLLLLNRACPAVLIGFLVVLTGCGLQKSYDARRVRAEYGRALPSAPVPSSPKAESGVLPLPLSLSRAIETAINSNPDMDQAVFRIQRAKATKKLAGSAFWPRLGFYTRYTQGDAPSGYLFNKIDQRKLPPDINFNDPGWFENWETGINARLNLFAGGADSLKHRMADAALEASRLDREAIGNELTAQTVKAYYDILAARDLLDIAEDSVGTVSEQLRIMRVQQKGGAALKSEVLSLEVRLAEAEEEVVRSRNRLKLARAALGSLMGLDPAALSEAQAVVVRSRPPEMELPDAYKEGMAYAMNHRPELERIRKQLIRSRLQVDAARSSYLPRLDLTGRYYMDDPEMAYDRDRENWTAGLVFNWDLFAGFSRKARVDEADAMLREMLAVDRKTTLGVKLDVKNAYLNREAAMARYEVAASSVESAEASYRMVKEHYEGGAATVTRYLEVELARRQAHIRKTAAFYDKIQAEADLARAIGWWSGRRLQPEDDQMMP